MGGVGYIAPLYITAYMGCYTFTGAIEYVNRGFRSPDNDRFLVKCAGDRIVRAIVGDMQIRADLSRN